MIENDVTVIRLFLIMECDIWSWVSIWKHPLLITKTKQREWNGWMRAVTQADFTSMQCMQKVNPNNLFLWPDSLVFNINSDKHIFINSYLHIMVILRATCFRKNFEIMCVHSQLFIIFLKSTHYFLIDVS